ncbi:hypothetical protein [Stenotrophomonas sp. NPDC077659]|uniref:hypothetical protein n=1 Tax=Stenotrophomonas sp. NPDC077659 TaxID=3390694 RepID=UPI003D01667F
MAKLAQHESFSVLLQVDGAILKAGPRAVADVEQIDNATISLVAAARHLLQRNPAQIGDEGTPWRDTLTGAGTACIAVHLQGSHRQRRVKCNAALR